MTMIKGAKTIGEFKIRMFIARHFAEGSVEVEIMGRNDAIIYDRYGEEMAIKYDSENDKIICSEKEGEEHDR